MALNLCCMCQCMLQAVFWSLIGIYLRFLYAEPRMQHRRTFIPLSVSLWNDLGDPVFDGLGRAASKSKANDSVMTQAAPSIFLLFTLFRVFLSAGGLVGLGSSDW